MGRPTLPARLKRNGDSRVFLNDKEQKLVEAGKKFHNRTSISELFRYLLVEDAKRNKYA